MYKLVIPGRPISKSNTYGARIIGRRAIIYTKKELEDYELLVGEIADSVIGETLTGLHSLYLRIYQYGKRWIDVDNSFKGVIDGLDASKVIKRWEERVTGL